MKDDAENIIHADVHEIVDVDRLLHEPSRMVICTVLYVVKRADFLYLQRQTGLTRGNLSSHLQKLEKNDYIEIEKTFDGKTPRTTCELTDTGRAAFDAYRETIKRLANQLPD